MTAWTEERALIAMASCKSGLSMSEIAKLLGGVSRNAVIGKLHRMGHWPGRPLAAEKPEKVKRPKNAYRSEGGKAATRRHKVPKLTYAAGKFSRDESIVCEDKRDIPPEQSKCAVSLLDAKDGQCRWPISEPGAVFMFCGEEMFDDGHPYCERHARMAYQPGVKRRECGGVFIPARGVRV